MKSGVMIRPTDYASGKTWRTWKKYCARTRRQTPIRVLQISRLTKDEEIRRLQAENKRLRMEREILKKATAFFARHQS